MRRNALRMKYYKQKVKRRHKRNIKPLLAALVLVTFWYVVIGKNILPQVFESTEASVEAVAATSYRVPCTEANLAKLLAYTLNETIGISENEEEAWYSAYYKLIEQNGITSLKEMNAQKIVDRSVFEKVLGEALGQAPITSDFNPKDDEALTMQEIIDTYYTACKEAHHDVYMNYMEIAILVTPAEGKSLEAWQVETNQGQFGFKGLIVEPLKNKTIKVAVKDKEILGIMEITSKECVIESCTLSEVTKDSVTIKIGENSITLKNNGLKSELKEQQGQLRISGDAAIAFEIEDYPNKDVLLKVTDSQVVFEKAGTLDYKAVSITDHTDIGSYQHIRELPYGTQVGYREENGKLIALEVIGRSNSDGIRVVLANEKKGYYHEWVKLLGTSDYDMEYNGKQSTLDKETVWDSESFNWEKGVDTIYFIPREESALKLFNYKKNGIFPKYKGTLEITKTEKGYVIVNAIDLEDYVAAVIPSEMPTSYGLEALKVQAVAARTYAAASKKSSKFMCYGAHIDDTTASQVYNNIAPNELAYEAAAATAGQVLSDEGNIISSKFFASSCGYTANLGEVWASGESFPSSSPEYLVSKPQYEGKALVDNLKDETDAYEFFTLSPQQVEAYDSDSPWFRWQVSLSQEELSDFVNSSLSQMSKDYPSLVKILDGNENWISKKIDTLGVVQDMEVAERGEGGNIMKLVIKGSKCTVQVSTEYLIRSLFANNDKHRLKIKRGDGTEIDGMSMLPSAFFAPQITYNKHKVLSSITLFGGGFGHGVGMSQDGVKGMAKLGYDYKEIINHYYQGAELVNIE